MADEDLAVTTGSRADADHRHREIARDLLREAGGDLLEHESEGARVLQGDGVAPNLIGLHVGGGAYLIAAELVDRLRRQAQVTHDRNAHLH